METDSLVVGDPKPEHESYSAMHGDQEGASTRVGSGGGVGMGIYSQDTRQLDLCRQEERNEKEEQVASGETGEEDSDTCDGSGSDAPRIA